MKRLLLGLLTLSTMSAFSYHVEDTDLFVNVGQISNIKLLKTLNIKPNTARTQLGNKDCWLLHDTVDFDRSLSAPRDFKFTALYTWNFRDSSVNDATGFYFKGLKSAQIIYCRVGNLKTVTVGDMRESLKGYVEFTLSEPVEME